MRTAVAVVIAAAAAASCATAGGGAVADRAINGTIEMSGSDGLTMLRIVNASPTDFDVHVIHSGNDGMHRLGRVAALATAEFELTHVEEMREGFYIVAQPVGTTTGYLSSLFDVTPGERITARIAPTANANVIAQKGM